MGSDNFQSGSAVSEQRPQHQTLRRLTQIINGRRWWQLFPELLLFNSQAYILSPNEPSNRANFPILNLQAVCYSYSLCRCLYPLEKQSLRKMVLSLGNSLSLRITTLGNLTLLLCILHFITRLVIGNYQIKLVFYLVIFFRGLRLIWKMVIIKFIQVFLSTTSLTKSLNFKVNKSIWVSRTARLTCIFKPHI